MEILACCAWSEYAEPYISVTGGDWEWEEEYGQGIGNIHLTEKKVLDFKYERKFSDSTW